MTNSCHTGGGPYKIIRLRAPALAEVIAVFEQGKQRIVSLDNLEEFWGENIVHGLPSDPPHPLFQGGDEITEIPSLELERLITEGVKSQERQLDRTRPWRQERHSWSD